MPHGLSEENLFPCTPTQLPVLETTKAGNTQSKGATATVQASVSDTTT